MRFSNASYHTQKNTMKQSQSQYTNTPKDTKKHTDILLHVCDQKQKEGKKKKHRKIVERFPFF